MPERTIYQNPPSLKQPMFLGKLLENPCVFLEELDVYVQFFDERSKLMVAKSEEIHVLGFMPMATRSTTTNVL